MQTRCTRTPRRESTSAFSFPEVLMGIMVLGVVVGALYGAFAQGTLITQMTREDLRATQILLEKSEALRLCGWQQFATNGVPTNFTAAYDPGNSGAGPAYGGSISIVNAPMAGFYSNNLKTAHITVRWKTGSVARQRELRTFIARYGLQTYVD